MSIHTGYSKGVELEYDAPKQHEGMSIGAYVRINLHSDRGSFSLVLRIEEARAVAEQLPALIMAHDAAEHAAKERAAAESKAA
ncbi:hypothetical protein [Nocardia sp. AG03]|uniref:hypothetical protein n=1 Tax=Nocardia sp. AG03 TaxID=3025312 RepID=UPI00241863AC|nr:hypothetical protein [Nocardia sp. AG03]